MPLLAAMRDTVARLRLYGIDYQVDLEACREALLKRAAELRAAGATTSGFSAVAGEAHVSRRTLERFFAGESLSVESFADIVTRGLRLNVPDVISRIEEEERTA